MFVSMNGNLGLHNPAEPGHELPEILISMTDWVALGYPVIASFKVLLHAGKRSPNVFSKRVQSNAEKSGRVAGVRNSSLRPGSRA